MRTNIIIFDKQDITRFGLEMLIAKLYLQKHTVFLADAKSNLVQNLVANPDSLVVIDYTLSDLNSADSLLNISVRFPKTHWVLFSEELSVQFLKKIQCNDSFSVILKNSDLSEIKKAISFAFEKQAFICSQVKELLAMSGEGSSENNSPLTSTEKEILREIALGKTAKEIAFFSKIGNVESCTISHFPV